MHFSWIFSRGNTTSWLFILSMTVIRSLRNIKTSLNISTYQALAIDTIPVRFVMVASSSKWKMSLLSIHKVESMTNEIILACNATASIRILDTGCYLHTNTREATNLLLVSFAQPCRVFIRGENLVASLETWIQQWQSKIFNTLNSKDVEKNTRLYLVCTTECLCGCPSLRQLFESLWIFPYNWSDNQTWCPIDFFAPVTATVCHTFPVQTADLASERNYQLCRNSLREFVCVLDMRRLLENL